MADDSNAEIQQWFTSHGKVTAANTVPDPSNRNSTLIEYLFEDGSKLTVRPSTPMTDDKGQPTGTSTPQEIVGRELPKPAVPGSAQDPNRPQNRNEQILQQQREKNAALPKDQDPAYETDEERRTRGDARIKQQGADAAAAEARARQAKIDADAAANTAADNKRADDEAAARRAAANKPSVTLTDDGKGGKVAVVTTPDGKVSSVPVPGVQGAPPTLTVQGTVYQLQPDGKTYAPAAGIPNPNAPIPAGAPKFVPDYSRADLGLPAYNEQLLTWGQSGANGATRDVGRQLMEQAGALATVTGSHGSTLRNEASTQRSQDITQRQQDLGEVQSRRTDAGGGYDTLFQDINANAAHLGRGNGGLAADAFLAAYAGRTNAIQQTGGFAAVPQVPLSPAMQAMRTTTVHPDGKVVHSTPVFEPRADPNGAPVAPSGAAASGGGSVSAQSVAAPAAVPAAPAAAPDMRNSSDMDLPPGTPTAGPANRESFPADYGGNTFNPGINPPAVEPGNDPTAPVGQVPAYLRPAPSVFDPSPVVAELRQRGFTDAAIRQALDEHMQEQQGMVAA